MKRGPKPRENVERSKWGDILCEHKKRSFLCRECKGAAFCKHDKRKSYCLECGGASLCVHDKRKDRCKDCGGTGLCIHGVGKSYCKRCSGSSICEHNRERRRCSVCEPSGAFKKYKAGAAERNLSFSLTLEDFNSLVSRPCYFCKEESEPRGIDRWNNTIGYENSNSVSCCSVCNFAKKKMLGSEFILMCQQVSKTHPSE